MLRTPDECFAAVEKSFSYTPHYLTDLEGFEGIRIHYVDEVNYNPESIAKERNASRIRVYLCLHGEPTWCYLYRKMIPILLKHGGRYVRVVCPDFIGFGRSDKFKDSSKYTFDMHRNMIIALIKRLQLTNITLVCQDWGGLIGLTLPLDLPDRFTRLFAMNTSFTPGTTPLTRGFYEWREYAAKSTDLPIGAIIKRATPHLTDEEVAAYDAPFPTSEYKAGPRMFPQLVPDSPDSPGAELHRRALAWWKDSRIPAVVVIGVKDPIIGKKGMLRFLENLGGPCTIIEEPEAGHFVQEWGEKFTERALTAFKRMQQLQRQAKRVISEKNKQVEAEKPPNAKL